MTESIYCAKCGFPPEYCEYSAVCAGTKKEAAPKSDTKIVVTTKRVSGNKKVTLVRNLHTIMNSAQMKEVSKKFAKLIACGSSIVKNGSGTDDISVQTSEDLRVIEILTKAGVPKAKIERITKSS